jgi:hypothetical protein
MRKLASISLSLFWLLSMLLVVALTSASAQVKPLIRAHAHNDYAHTRPLLDALDCGFCSVEADIHLVDGQLLVAHDRFAVKPDRTLQSLYLDPLRERVKKNGGRVYPQGPTFFLLIDIKTEPEETYARLRTVLESYADIFTSYKEGEAEKRAIIAVITGNRPRKTIAAEAARYCVLDGELSDLDGKAPASLVAWVSAEWGREFKWRGVGPMPDNEKVKLAEMVRKAKAHGYLLRFWGAPESVDFWKTLLDAGVGLINADHLQRLQELLLSRPDVR